METLLKEVGLALCDIRRRKPLIHEITNYVTATDCANITLALGAKPIMATRPVEAKEVITRAKGVVLNLGTLDDERLKIMEKVAAIGTDHGVPMVLDPVGAGSMESRANAAGKLLEVGRMAVIRGNSDEITSLATGKLTQGAGVDNSGKIQLTGEEVREFSRKLGTVVAVTGAVDIISDGKRTVSCYNGSPLLPFVTGTGCMTTALIAAFASVTDSFTAAVGGILSLGLASEMVVNRDPRTGPGTLRQRLCDCVFELHKDIYILDGRVVKDYE